MCVSCFIKLLYCPKQGLWCWSRGVVAAGNNLHLAAARNQPGSKHAKARDVTVRTYKASSAGAFTPPLPSPIMIYVQFLAHSLSIAEKSVSLCEIGSFSSCKEGSLPKRHHVSCSSHHFGTTSLRDVVRHSV